jgi:hypothetical protein
MHRMKRILRRPSPGLVIAFLALLAAMAGTAGARTLITGASIKAGSLTGRNVKNGSLTGKDIHDHSITARDLSHALKFRTSAASGTAGAAGLAGADGANGSDAVFVPLDTKPAFPQQVDCRVELPPVDNNVAGDGNEDQDDSGRSMINFNEQTTLDMNRIITVGGTPTTQTPADKLELSCWQPKRTGKGDGVVITGIKLSLLRIDANTNLNPDPPLPQGGFQIGGDTGTPRVVRNFQFNNGDERVLIKGLFQDKNDAEVNGVTNPAKDQLATPILSIPIDPTKTFADCAVTPCTSLPQGRYQLLAHVRTDKVRRSTDVDKLGRPTTQAPHVQPGENAEPLQSQTLQP